MVGQTNPHFWSDEQKTIAEEDWGQASEGKGLKLAWQECKSDHSPGLNLHQGISHGVGYVLVIGLVVGLFMPMVRSVISFVMWLVIFSVTSSHQSDQMSQGLKSQKSQFVSKFLYGTGPWRLSTGSWRLSRFPKVIFTRGYLQSYQGS